MIDLHHFMMYNLIKKIQRRGNMIEHRVVSCKEKRSKIEKTCDKMGKDDWAFAGHFRSRFLFIFNKHYLVFTRNSK